jgi:hypothetical protein
MFSYGIYSIGWAVADLARGARLELWAELGLMLFGALLMLAAAFVRVRLPGGVAFAIGAMLGLQALAVHDAAHLGTGVVPQMARAALAVTLTVLAFLGSRNREPSRAVLSGPPTRVKARVTDVARSPFLQTAGVWAS